MSVKFPVTEHWDGQTYYTDADGKPFSKEQAFDVLVALGEMAAEIMAAKGSYDCPNYSRVAAEYERAYTLIQDMAQKYGPRDGRIIEGEVMKNRLPESAPQLTSGESNG